MNTAPTYSDDMRSLIDAHMQSLELLFTCHEQRMAAIDAESAQRIAATLARLDLELDALAERAGRER